jgi:hypothetical protein
VKEPGRAAADAVSVSIEACGEVLEEMRGGSVMLTPDGRPDWTRVTIPPKPFRGVKIICDVPELPWAMERDAGLA